MNFSPRWMPSTSSAMAVGWAPAGAKSETTRKGFEATRGRSGKGGPGSRAFFAWTGPMLPPPAPRGAGWLQPAPALVIIPRPAGRRRRPKPAGKASLQGTARSVTPSCQGKANSAARTSGRLPPPEGRPACPRGSLPHAPGEPPARRRPWRAPSRRLAGARHHHVAEDLQRLLELGVLQMELRLGEPLVDLLLGLVVHGDGHVRLDPRLVDEPPARRLVAAGGEGEASAPRKGDDRLNQALAEGGGPHQGGHAPVLQGPRDDLARAGAELVDQHHHGHPGEGAGALGPVGKAPLVPVDHMNDGAVLQEEVRHLNGGRQKPPGIVPQVQEEALRPALEHLPHRRPHLCGGPLVEGAELDVP